MSTPKTAALHAAFSRDFDEARQGSRDALGRILEQCRPYLLQIANSELDDDLQAKAGASDLVQQTFLEAQQDLTQFNGDDQSELLAWLRRILLNNLANFRRHYRDLHKRSVGREVSLNGDDSSQDPIAQVPDKEPSPSSCAALNEREQLLERVLQGLPEHYRSVIVMRHRQHCSFEVIGNHLGCTDAAARKLWLRAVERLQEELAHAVP